MRQAKTEEKKRQEQAKREREMTRVDKAKVTAIKALAAPCLKRNIR